MQPWQTESLVTLAVSLFIVFRFVKRELGARVVRSRTLWIRPTLLFAGLIFLCFATLHAREPARELLVLAVAGGALFGGLTGALVVRSTTFSSEGVPGALRVHGSRVTAGLWIGAFLLRIVARLLVPHSGQGVQLALNSGLIALVAVAFAVVALAFHREIGRYAGLPAGERLAQPALGSTAR